jgi:hypothetical protein
MRVGSTTHLTGTKTYMCVREKYWRGVSLALNESKQVVLHRNASTVTSEHASHV